TILSELSLFFPSVGDFGRFFIAYSLTLICTRILTETGTGFRKQLLMSIFTIYIYINAFSIIIFSDS
ncbi:MAG TPA: hypothetical protein PKK05_26320, partial [Leptospiraceae bacterium]|nr:hypothetical protein [Leptospiraceae bacterium]